MVTPEMSTVYSPVLSYEEPALTSMVNTPALVIDRKNSGCTPEIIGP